MGKRIYKLADLRAGSITFPFDDAAGALLYLPVYF